MPEPKLLNVNIEDDVAVVTFNDPKTRNAFSEQMGAEFRDLMPAIAKQARALVITGDGPGFCSGADLNSTGEAVGPKDLSVSMREIYNPAMLALRALEVPVISAVNGPCAGIGCSIAMSADISVVSSKAFFLQAFSKIGLVPDGGACYILAKSAGRARAMELVMLDEKLSPEQALAWGLINRVVEPEELMPTALGIAKKLAKGPTRAYAHMRKLMWSACEADYEDQLALESVSQGELGFSKDHSEGVRAFMAREKPNYKGE